MNIKDFSDDELVQGTVIAHFKYKDAQEGNNIIELIRLKSLQAMYLSEMQSRGIVITDVNPADK